MVQVQMTPRTNDLIPVHYDATSSSTSTTPDPDQVAKVYSLQRRREREAAKVDWAAEAATWGEETRAWVEEVREAGDEALPD